MSSIEICVVISTLVICFVTGVLCGVTTCLIHDINKMIEKINNKTV